jgi:hypothetical protein
MSVVGRYGGLATMFPGMVLWLRSDLGVTLSGSNVTNWSDLSGNHLDAKTISGLAPTYGTAPPINGYSTLQYIHANTSCQQINDPRLRPTTGITLMAVMTEVLADCFICCQSDLTCVDGFGMKTTNGGAIQADWYVGNISVAKVGVNSFTGGNHLYIGTWDINTGIMAFYNNNVLIGTASFAGPISYSGNSPSLQIDSKNASTANNPTANASANIAEIGMWPRALSANELILLTRFMNLRYRLF